MPEPTTPDASGGDMDDILASIRRILHADSGDSPPVSHPETEQAADTSGPIFDLQPSMIAPDHQTVQPETSRHDFADLHATTPPLPKALAEDMSTISEPTLLGERAQTESGASLSALRAALDARAQPQPTQSAPIYRHGGLTIEDVVRDEVRGLLGTWLDEHLPALVERLVRAEIDRISAGR